MKRLSLFCLVALPVGVVFYFADLFGAAVIGR